MTPIIPAGMVQVTADEFYAAVGPLDVHPSVLHSTEFCVWELRDRRVVGRSYPGWKNPGDPQAYMVATTYAPRKAA